MSTIGPPSLPSDIIGPFGPFKISFFVHQGRFEGKTSKGDFIVPYWITTPVNPEQADGVCFFEPQHRFSRSVGLNLIFGPNFLLAGGASHATVEHRRNGVGDLEILQQFAVALKQSQHVIKRVDKLYCMGFSETGNIVHELYRHQLFDLTLACTATYNKAYSPPVNLGGGQKRIIVFGTEREFVPELIQHVAQNANFPQYRWYTAACAPHIPDTQFTRQAYTDPPPPPPPGGLRPVPVAGSTPIRWDLFLRALLVAGHAWVHDEKHPLPPPSVTLRLKPGDPTQLERDSMCNALGGIRHPALETREATFFASVPRGNWPFFGAYGNMRTIEGFQGFDAYFGAFKQAVESLIAARFLRTQEADKLLREAQLNRANTFTRNYAMGLFV